MQRKIDQQEMKFVTEVTSDKHFGYAEEIVEEMESSAKVRGTGIAKRTPEYIREKMNSGSAVIALTEEGEWAGFCYIETWSDGAYASNSGLIVSPKFRNMGLASMIKEAVFNLTRSKYADAKLFGITTGLAVMKINSRLGYYPVTFAELTKDDEFWSSCQSCVNYPILQSKDRKNCLCTAMLYIPPKKEKENN